MATVNNFAAAHALLGLQYLSVDCSDADFLVTWNFALEKNLHQSPQHHYRIRIQRQHELVRFQSAAEVGVAQVDSALDFLPHQVEALRKNKNH